MTPGRGDLGLGHGAEGPLWVSKTARDVHMHVVGGSRMGKSYFLEHCIRQDIARGAGVCVIDPHGELYQNLVDWLVTTKAHNENRRIHLINPSQGQWSVGFNPLCRSKEPIGARVSAMLQACERVWDDGVSDSFRTLRKLLNMIFTTLAYHNLSLREVHLLSTLPNRDIRQNLVAQTGDQQLIDLWAQEDAKKDEDFADAMDAVTNRFWEMTRAPGVMSMLGQTNQTLDFKTCMNRNHIVLINLAHAGQVPVEVGRILGALITADLNYRAHSRSIDTAGEYPFYCYIDECQKYINETVVEGLDETAKYGLHYILSHQGLDQLGKPDDKIRQGVMRGAQNKIVFLQDDNKSAAELGEHLFSKEFGYERPKSSMIRPTVVGVSREWLESEGQSRGVSEGEGLSSSHTDALAESMVMDVDEPTIRQTASLSNASAESSFWGISQSYATGRAETLMPIYEDLPTELHSLEEQKHEAMVKVRLLQKRQAYAYLAENGERKAQQFCTADLYPALPSFDEVPEFDMAVHNKEPYSKLSADVEHEVKQRAIDLGATGSVIGDDTDGYD